LKQAQAVLVSTTRQIVLPQPNIRMFPISYQISSHNQSNSRSILTFGP
jgi:hypothetical protein